MSGCRLRKRSSRGTSHMAPNDGLTLMVSTPLSQWARICSTPWASSVEALAERRQGRLAGIGQAQRPGQAAEQGHLEQFLQRL